MIFISLLYLFSLSYLISTGYQKKYRKHHITAKTLTSLGFVLIAFTSLFLGKDGTSESRYVYFISLLPGLIFCTAGDIFLAIRSITKKLKWFAWGITMFALAHVLFVISIDRYADYAWWTYLIPLVSVVIAYILFDLPTVDAGKAKWACLIYAYVVTLFGVRAFICMHTWEYSMQGILLFMGALLFFASDTMLVFLYFGKEKIKWLHAANLVSYYLGVGLVAMSIYFAR